MIIIVGKRSNLSLRLYENLSGSIITNASDFEKIVISCMQNNIQSYSIVLNNFQSSVDLYSDINYGIYIKNTIQNTANILDIIQKSNIKINKLIYSSSSSVYGNNKFCSESDQVQPMSLQASLKVTNEELIKRFCYSRGINFTIARIFNMYGGNDNFSVISKIKKAYREKESLSIVNDGHSIRDYIHIDDVVNVYRTLLSTDKHYPVVNVALGQGNRISEILNFLKNHHISVKTENTTRDEIKASIADVTLLSELIDIDKFINVHEYLLNELSEK